MICQWTQNADCSHLTFGLLAWLGGKDGRYAICVPVLKVHTAYPGVLVEHAVGAHRVEPLHPLPTPLQVRRKSVKRHRRAIIQNLRSIHG